jgi:poly(A) polymerase
LISQSRGLGDVYKRQSRTVGEAWNFLLELRLDEGPLGETEAEARLRAWAADRDLA